MPENESLFAIDGPRAVVPRQAATSEAFAISERIKLPNAELARPANTTAYAAGQAWGTASSVIYTFTNGITTLGGRGLVISGRASKNGDNLTNAAFRLWLFNTATLTAQPAADQAAMNLSFSDRLKLIGMIDFPTWYDVGAMNVAPGVLSMEGGLPFKMAAGEAPLIGIVEARAAYVPISGETLSIEIGVRAETL